METVTFKVERIGSEISIPANIYRFHVIFADVVAASSNVPITMI